MFFSAREMSPILAQGVYSRNNYRNRGVGQSQNEVSVGVGGRGLLWWGSVGEVGVVAVVVGEDGVLNYFTS